MRKKSEPDNDPPRKRCEATIEVRAQVSEMPKQILRIALVLLFAITSASAFAQSKLTVPVDTKASTLKWTGHAEVGSYSPSGTLALSSGDVQFQKGSFSHAHLVVDMNSMAQDNSDLLHHLKSPDFFEVEHYPTATIDLDRYSAGSVAGTLTIRGKTTPFEAPAEVKPLGDHFVVSGRVHLDRTRYGITYNSKSFFSGLGEKAIRNQFEVEFTVVSQGPLPAGFR